jgi:hypothetical protein
MFNVDNKNLRHYCSVSCVVSGSLQELLPVAVAVGCVAGGVAVVSGAKHVAKLVGKGVVAPVDMERNESFVNMSFVITTVPGAFVRGHSKGVIARVEVSDAADIRVAGQEKGRVGAVKHLSLSFKKNRK